MVFMISCSKELKSGKAQLEPDLDENSLGAIAQSDAWIGHLGQNRDGHSSQSKFDANWSEREPQRLWRAKLGTGAAGVAVADGRVYGLGNSGDEDSVFCLDALSGEQIWRISYPCALDKRMFEGGPAAAPGLDLSSGRLFILSHEGELRCLDSKDGAEIWKRHYVEEFAGRRPTYGYAGAPLIVDGLLIIEPGAADGGVLALDAATGEERWSAGSEKPGYAAPSLFKHSGRPAVAVFNSYGLEAFELNSGEGLFRYRWETPYEINAAIPRFYAGHVFVSSGYGKGAALISIAKGKPDLVYETRDVMTQFQSPVRVGEHLFVVSGDNNTKASLTCLRFDDGSVRWRESLGGNRGNVIAVSGKLIVVTERGEALLVRAEAEGYEELGRFQASGGRCWAPPALADSQLYIRNNRGDLSCWDLR